MNWPFVRRRSYDAAIEELARKRAMITERDRALSAQGRRLVEYRRDSAKMLSDLRLVRVHVDALRPRTDRIRCGFEIDGAVFDGFRSDRTFIDLVSMMVYEAIAREPEGRSFMAGIGGPML